MKHAIRYEKPPLDETKATLEIETTIAEWRETLQWLRKDYPRSTLALMVDQLVSDFDKKYKV